jgi:two-component system LytT family response regulator
MIRCIIVDDELFAREGLQNMLHKHCPDVEILVKADTVNTALEAIRHYKPDLVLLDFKLPDGTGFDLLLQLDRISFHVIFVTAYDDQAVMAFRFSATDYLVKPVNVNDLKAAVEKVRQDLDKQQEAVNITALLGMMAAGKNQEDIINIPGIDGFKIINLDEIITCEADGFCTIFHLKEKNKVVSSKNLGYYEDMLVPKGFMRVHNSYIINLKHVREYSSEGVIKLLEGSTAPLGNTYKKGFLELFSKNK